MSTEMLEIKAELGRFQDAYTRGVAGIVEASEIYVRAIDDNPANKEKFREYFADNIPAGAWSNFEAVGRKWLHPRLLLGGMEDRRKAAIIKGLPYDTQTEIIEKAKRFPLLLTNGETLLVSVQDATPEQVKQLVDGSNIRNAASQKAYVEQLKSREAVGKCEPPGWMITDGKVRFLKGTILNKAQMRRILSEM